MLPQAEAAARALEAEAAQLRQRLAQAESQCRSREREAAALQRRLEGAWACQVWGWGSENHMWSGRLVHMGMQGWEVFVSRAWREVG